MSGGGSYEFTCGGGGLTNGREAIMEGGEWTPDETMMVSGWVGPTMSSEYRVSNINTHGWLAPFMTKTWFCLLLRKLNILYSE